MVVGGTSAVAPAVGGPDSPAQRTPWAHRSGLCSPCCTPTAARGRGFRDITNGNNGAYAAGPGWDACTGLGVPNGTTLLGRVS